ncbi:ESX secretion-associated protein EspG [Allokutzneria oryzae]|uniref:ESX secretion-associated protein EspG n=1 Tax=Allokutzneria oryzae TaxID=1378989 RepID=A0ABV5ZYV3_9PSEU
MFTETQREFGMSASAFQVAWERLDLPDMPPELLVMPAGVEEAQRRAVVHAALEELSGIDADGLEHALRVLARPSRSVDARLPMVRALAATDDEHAVIAVLSGDRVRIAEISPYDMCRAAVGMLPAASSGPGSSVCVPSDVVATAASVAGTSESVLCSELIRLGVRTEDSEQFALMVKDRHSSGQFGVTVLGRNGIRRRGDHVVSYFDTAHGRYLIKELRGWLTVAPADFRVLVGQVNRLLSETAQ